MQPTDCHRHFLPGSEPFPLDFQSLEVNPGWWHVDCDNIRQFHENDPSIHCSRKPPPVRKPSRKGGLDPPVAHRHSRARPAHCILSAAARDPNPTFIPFLASHPPSMKFHVHCQLHYTLTDPAAFLFSLRSIETGGQKI